MKPLSGLRNFRPVEKLLKMKAYDLNMQAYVGSWLCVVEFEIRYAVLGLRYTLDSFNRML